MMKLYDKSLNYIGTVPHKDLQIREELKTGYKTAQFLVPYSFDIQEEQKIEVDNYLFAVKEINYKNGMNTCYLKPYYGLLQSKRIDSLNGYNMSLADCMAAVVEDTDWTYEIAGNPGSFTINIQHETAIDTLRILKSLYHKDMFIDTLHRCVYFWEQRGEYKTAFYFNSSNIQDVEIQSNSYDLVTRLIPLGKDQTTIALVNNNSLWLDNFEYTDEVIVGYYLNSAIDNADDLMKAAQVKLDSVAKPYQSYKIKATALEKELNVGDFIKFVNEQKKLTTVLRVNTKVKGKETFYELGDDRLSFDDIYKDFQNSQKQTDKGILKSISQLIKNY